MLLDGHALVRLRRNVCGVRKLGWCLDDELCAGLLPSAARTVAVAGTRRRHVSDHSPLPERSNDLRRSEGERRLGWLRRELLRRPAGCSSHTVRLVVPWDRRRRRHDVPGSVAVTDA
jgi:hypothetical protein